MLFARVYGNVITAHEVKCVLILVLATVFAFLISGCLSLILTRNCIAVSGSIIQFQSAFC